MITGITIREDIGVGDKVQFASLPENYYRATGKRLVDLSRAWIYDYNPYVTREDVKCDEVVELWNFPQKRPWAVSRTPEVYLSNAEVTANWFNIPVVLNRPRLYRYENFPVEWRKKILLQTNGKSHGRMPDHIIDHVIKKYKPTGQLYHIGYDTDEDVGLPRISTPTLWDLAELLSRSRMLIGPDSGPTWVGACYPDLIIKKVRVREVHGQRPMSDWVPLEAANFHAHWDDRLFTICNPTEDDVGFMPSYRRI